MYEKLDLIEKRYEELNRLMADPEVATDPDRLREYAQEQAEIEELVQKYRQYKATERELSETRAMLEGELDEEMQALIKEEIERLEERREALLNELRLMLIPKDPRDERNVIVEIRAGAGGDEAGLFAADLYRMYTRYAERHGWITELLSAHETGIGGFKEVIFAVKGRGAYSRLKHESGVHRVQRVPITEASGRIHTSTATVAVLPEVEEVEIKIDPADLRIDVYRSSGPGGQHMQKNATAVRITHLPTGITVACESERSQFQNKEIAMRILSSRLLEREIRRREEEMARLKGKHVSAGWGNQIRSYVLHPYRMVKDHRSDFQSADPDGVLEGGGEVIGVIPRMFVNKGIDHWGLTEVRIVDSMHERKATMFDLADAFIALPGGLGTLDEFFEVVTWAQLGLHRKPCGLLNVSGYYDRLIGFLDYATAQRFVRKEHRAMLLVAEAPAALLQKFRAYHAPAVQKWLDQ